MDFQTALDIVNTPSKANKRTKQKLDKFRNIYYDISLHTTGTCPWFMPLFGGSRVYPSEYICEEYQWRFNNRLMNRHPNEPEESRWYRYSIYRPLTKAPFNRAMQVISGAIFQDSNYHITIEDKADSEYIWGNNFHGSDLIGYMANIGFRHIVEDPNGFFIRMPDKPYSEQNGERVTVKIHFINTRDIIDYGEDYVVFKMPDTDYCFYVDTQTIWRFTNKAGTKQFFIAPEDSAGYYAHLFGYLPITVAGGEWNTHGFYDSYLDNARALCDEFVSTFSAAQVVDKEASHPYIQSVQPDCPDCAGIGTINLCKSCKATKEDCNCDGGYTNFYPSKCGKCGGSGSQSRNPMQWINIPKEDADKNVDYIKYISPEIGINAHHREVVKHLEEQILQALHLYRTDKAESGEAKAIDQEWLYQFLTRICNHVFDNIIYDTIRDILAYRNVSVKDGVLSPAVMPFTIIKPNQFRIKTASDLLEELKVGKESGISMVLRGRMEQDFADKAYAGDEITRRKVWVTAQIDPCANYTIGEMLSLRTMGAISLEDVTFSQRMPMLLNKAIDDKGERWFLTAAPDDVETQLRTYLPKPNDLINGLQQGSTRVDIIE